MVLQSNNFSTREIEALSERTKDVARQRMLEFIVYTMPEYVVNWHHVILCDVMDDFIALRKRRIIVEAPPRTGKSQIVSRHGPAKIFGDNPRAKIIHATYGDRLTKRMNRDIQRIMTGREYRELFPESRLSVVRGDGNGDSRWVRNTKEFEIVGHGGSYMGTGVGGAINGTGATHLIIDDPVKDRSQADSIVYREKIWEWFTDDASNRLDGAGGILVMHTRWHDDDLVGRILKKQNQARKEGTLDPDYEWHVVSLPAIMEDATKKFHLDPRKNGQLLWPWHWAGRDNDLSPGEQVKRARAFLKSKENENAFGFASLYQQNPTPKKGAMFSVEKFQVIDALPSPIVAWIRYWDKAATKDGGKNSAGVKMARLANGQFCVLHVTKGQWAVEKREAMITLYLGLDGNSGQTWVEKEPGSGGKESADATVKTNAGKRIFSEPAQGNKVTRAEPFATQVNIGNVLIMRGDWNADYIEEHRRFPVSSFKDQVDASSGAFNKLNKKRDFSALTQS